MRFARFLTWGVALLLMITAALKLLEVTKHDGYFEEPDGIVGFLTNRQMMVVAALFEVVIAGYVWRAQSIANRSWAILWFCSVVAVYKIFLNMAHATVPCACLGIITSALKLSSRQAEAYTWSLLSLFALSATGCLFWQRTQNMKVRKQSIAQQAGN